jgi:hypothetical protein
MTSIQISGLLGESEQWLKTLSKEEIGAYLGNHLNSIYLLTNKLQEKKGDCELVKSDIFKSELVKSELVKSELVKSELVKGELVKSEIDKSVILGQYGEYEMFQICSKLPSCYTLKDTTKQGKAGDFVLEYAGPTRIFRCIIDCKNYRSPIPTKEINKFYDDIIYGNYDLGLLVSYNTKFVGYNNHIHIETKCLPHGQIPIMYLAMVPKDIVNKCIEMLFMYVETKFYKCPTDKIYTACSYINGSLNQMASVRRVLNEMQNSLQTHIQKCQEQIMTFEVQIKHALNEMTKPMDSEENKEKSIIDSIRPKRNASLLFTILNYDWRNKEFTDSFIILTEETFSVTISYKTKELHTIILYKESDTKKESDTTINKESSDLRGKLSNFSKKLNVYFTTKIANQI